MFVDFPVVRVLSNSYSVLLGNTATLECVITASPAASIVQWYRVINGQQQTIDSSSSNYNTPTVNNPSLRVLSAANSDEGYYICSASNPVGTASSAQTFLDVTGSRLPAQASYLHVLYIYLCLFILTINNLNTFIFALFFLFTWPWCGTCMKSI